jgi:hypothetical protein
VIIAAIDQLVLAIRAKHGAISAISAVGLLAIVAAPSSGRSFLSDQAEGASLGMALATAVAMLCYAVSLRIEVERSLPAAPAGAVGGLSRIRATDPQYRHQDENGTFSQVSTAGPPP